MADELAIPRARIHGIVARAHRSGRKIKVEKRNGGYRYILQPTVDLKLIQRWLLERIFSKLCISSVASAFRPGASIVDNAYVHRCSRYLVRVDIADFFPSIHSADLILRCSESFMGPLEWIDRESFFTLVRQVCFDGNDCLPMGYVTSPSIANVVMYALDEELLEIISADFQSYGNAKLTRYADDFVFSSDQQGSCRRFVAAMYDLLARTNSPRLKIKRAKTRFMNRSAGSALVTGLRIRKDGIVRVHANYRDHVRLLLKLFSANKLERENVSVLRGHLAYIQDADPLLFTKLSHKYYMEISKLRGFFQNSYGS